MQKDKIKVLIVDDSALVRKVLTMGFAHDPDIEVVGAACDPYQARDLLVEKCPDVITLDVEMPRMDGVTFLKKFMPTMPVPTVMVSSLTEAGKKITIAALEAGAVDVVQKPKVGLSDDLPAMMPDICARVKAAAKVNVKNWQQKSTRVKSALKEIVADDALDQSTDKVIAIGASTGGVEALARILPAFPAATPGIIIVQHMPYGFTASFAERLNGKCAMQVKEAENGDRVRQGLVLIAPGGEYHTEVYRSGGQYRIRLIEGPPVHSCKPAVDIMFASVAKYVGKNAIGLLMTGMGKDGAKGLLKIQEADGATFTQDEKTCVVYGMPHVAWELGAAKVQLALDKIPGHLLMTVKRM